MDDGYFKILRVVSGHGGLSADAIVRASGEARTVLQALREAKPDWLVEREGLLCCTEKGFEAYCREAYAREVKAVDAEALAAYARIAARRPPADRALDQVYATADTALERARVLVSHGETQRGLCLLGDDDLTSVALGILGVTRRVTVLEIDERLTALLETASEELGLDRKIVRHDLRDPTPRELRGKFGAVFTDPPYAIEGFRLFVARATELLREDGKLIVSFGQSRRSVERGLEKQRALVELGYFIEEVKPDLVRYDGAESIGASSSLYVCRRTPLAKVEREARVEGDLYSARSPKRRK